MNAMQKQDFKGTFLLSIGIEQNEEKLPSSKVDKCIGIGDSDECNNSVTYRMTIAKSLI